MTTDRQLLEDAARVHWTGHLFKWAVFSAMWIAGLAAANMLSGLSTSRLFFSGGMWMLACMAALGVIDGYQTAKARRAAIGRQKEAGNG